MKTNPKRQRAQDHKRVQRKKKADNIRNCSTSQGRIIYQKLIGDSVSAKDMGKFQFRLKPAPINQLPDGGGMV